MPYGRLPDLIGEPATLHSMKPQFLIRILGVIAIAILLIAFWLRPNQLPTATPAAAPASVPSVSSGSGPTQPNEHVAAPAASGTNKVFKISAGQILATVNGHALTLRDLVPTRTNNEQEMSQTAYKYLLDRAINRELVLEAAAAGNIGLTETQQEQLTKLRGLRESSEPGLITKLNRDPEQVEFEIRDADAFMLQTALMARQGATPNVTPEQVAQFYQDHLSVYGSLPDDPQAKERAWQQIDVQIRNRLAEEQRDRYNQQVQAYMDNLRSNANIVLAQISE